MADLLTAVVLMLGGVSAAEFVRSTCRRRLLTPVSARRAATSTGTGLTIAETRVAVADSRLQLQR